MHTDRLKTTWDLEYELKIEPDLDKEGLRLGSDSDWMDSTPWREATWLCFWTLEFFSNNLNAHWILDQEKGDVKTSPEVEERRCGSGNNG